MKATILTVGDEILIGQVVNTNAAWIGEHLEAAGLTVIRMETVGDDPASMSEAVLRAVSNSSLLVVTGGLGPTHDDITKQVIADVFERPLKEDPDVIEHVRQLFERRGRRMSDRENTLGLVPEGFLVLDNPIGTAPGLWGEVNAGNSVCYVVLLPGVPYEMKALMENEVLPRLAGHPDVKAVLHRTIRTSGAGEVQLAEKIGSTFDSMSNGVRLAYLPNPKTGVKLRLTVRADDMISAEKLLQEAENHIVSRLEKHVYGYGKDELEEVVGALLRERSLTVATAESCTGGRIADRLTDIPGSSDYLVGSVVAYSNQVKVSQLGVTQKSLDAFGAVSEQVAREMAEGIRRITGADIGLSTTGIAGPGGGTEEKPVGTVWIGYSDDQHTEARKLILTKNRHLNKELSATYTLYHLFRNLKDL